MDRSSMPGRDNLAETALPTPTRFLMECGEYKLNPESNPFEQSFQKNPFPSDSYMNYTKSHDQEQDQPLNRTSQSQNDDSSNDSEDTNNPYSHKRRNSSNNDDSEEKRKKFLERNRMAASKCRQKKKVWMQELEMKSEEVTDRNKSLHMMVGQLKEEVLQLKGQLLAHRNCNCNVIQQYVQTSGHFALNPANTRNPSMMYYYGK
ncbi:hypothetical protein K7432_000321 [Basidiobolus ranarum]|uniref:BZIP domain-containing protein n=1 Tax=Basidiobolus ranarum TaxID=34480 RepID=A0ABR2X4Z0_9FUNG